jgi:hypothetical protein
MAQAAAEVSGTVTLGDFMIALGVPIVIRGIAQYYRVARIMFPIVSFFPMGLLFYGSGGARENPRYWRYFEDADLIAGDFMFMRSFLPDDLAEKTILTNTTTADDVELLRERGATTVITTTPRYEGRSFGTNMMEAALTAHAGLGRVLTDAELNDLINELDLRPSVARLNDPCGRPGRSP